MKVKRLKKLLNDMPDHADVYFPTGIGAFEGQYYTRIRHVKTVGPLNMHQRNKDRLSQYPDRRFKSVEVAEAVVLDPKPKPPKLKPGTITTQFRLHPERD